MNLEKLIISFSRCCKNYKNNNNQVTKTYLTSFKNIVLFSYIIYLKK